MESNLEAELRLWKEREQRYEKLFSPSVLKSREFLKEKLKHYDEIRAKTVANPLNIDSIAMRAFQLERAALARQVYPNVLRRWLDKVIHVFSMPNKVAKVLYDTTANHQEVQAAMGRTGLGNYFKQAEQQMKQGNREFSLPVSYQVSEHEKIDLQLHLKKNHEGKYQFENYRASLHSDLKKGQPKRHVFTTNESTAYNPDQAYNLLAGRAVQPYGSTSWHQLDFNDKDAEGNYRMKNFESKYGFELDKSLATLPLKQQDKIRLLEKLRDGHKVEVPITLNKETFQVQIHADPLRKEIAVYDIADNRVKLEDLLGQTQPDKSAKVQQLVPKQSFDKTVSKSKQVKL